MALRFLSQVVIPVVGDGSDITIELDIRDMERLPGFKPGTKPDSVISAVGCTATLTNHIVTLTISPALADGETRNVTINFGING